MDGFKTDLLVEPCLFKHIAYPLGRIIEKPISDTRTILIYLKLAIEIMNDWDDIILHMRIQNPNKRLRWSTLQKN